MKSNAIENPVGKSLRISRTRTLSAAVLAIGIVIIDFVLILFRVQNIHAYRIILAISAVICLLLLAGGNLSTIGVVFRPRYGFRYWIKATIVVAAVIALLLSLVIAAFWFTDINVSLPRTAPQSFSRTVLVSCIEYPLLEETLYRLVFLTPLVVLLGGRWTILVGGVVFAALHFAYGNPAPDNFVAGYFLAWAYLKSGSVLIPIAWHSLGNACAHAIIWVSWHLTN